MNDIEEMCEKLGISGPFSELVPELAKHEISVAGLWLFVAATVMMLSACAISYFVSEAEKEIDKNGLSLEPLDFWYVKAAYTIGFIVIFVFFLVCVFSLSEIVSWTSSPEAAAIQYMLVRSK